MAGEYTYYRDRNNVMWTVISAARSMFATVRDGQEPRYDPPAPDLGPVTKVDMPDSSTDKEIAERDRATFIKLRELIDTYAADHQQTVILRVPANAGGAGWVVVAALVLWALSEM